MFWQNFIEILADEIKRLSRSRMADGPTTKEIYFRVCSETKRTPDSEILAVLNHAIDQQIL